MNPLFIALLLVFLLTPILLLLFSRYRAPRSMKAAAKDACFIILILPSYALVSDLLRHGALDKMWPWEPLSFGLVAAAAKLGADWYLLRRERLRGGL